MKKNMRVSSKKNHNIFKLTYKINKNKFSQIFVDFNATMTDEFKPQTTRL